MGTQPIGQPWALPALTLLSPSMTTYGRCSWSMAGEMITSLKALLSPQMAKYVGSSCSQQLRGTQVGKKGVWGSALCTCLGTRLDLEAPVTLGCRSVLPFRPGYFACSLKRLTWSLSCSPYKASSLLLV